MRNPLAQLARTLVVAFVLVSSASAFGAEDDLGKTIYLQQCADCHGANGEGVKDAYPNPLAGDKPLVELTRVISETMPEGAPEECVAEDAEAVAKYVYDTFYSRVAQARNRPARVAFSRLTVRQYENTVADLLGSFTGSGHVNGERGLRAEYYDDRRYRREKRVEERIDATVDFDFGEGVPIPEKTKPEAFAIRWRGSVIAPETGDYEFVLVTENGARLSVNGERVVDRWVKSGDDRVHTGSIHLLGGRAYPLDLEFFTFKEKTASIRLEWKRPHHVREVIPERSLSPKGTPTTFVLQTKFPPDDASEGYVRGTSVSKEWYDAATRAALEVSARAAAVSGAADGKSADQLKQFCRTFAERALRRPLSDDEVRLYVEQPLANADDPVAGVRRATLQVLLSPRFLYRSETGDGVWDAYDVAAWLSYALWDSLPDQTLRDAAAKDEIRTRDQIAWHVRRMLGDPRTKSKIMDFSRHWLQFHHFAELAKDTEAFPGFDEHLVSDLRTSVELTIEHWLDSEKPDLRELFLGEKLWANERMAGYYGLERPEETSAFTLVETESRSGLVTHPYLLAGFAYDAETSPIHRGVFVARSLLGRRLRPPPIAVTPVAPDLHPDLTTRERVELQTSPASCRNCHNLINPLGFPLETFDAVGRLREKDGRKPLDVAGHYLDRTGRRTEFEGPREFARFLAESGEVHEAFAEQLFQHTVKQPAQAWGPGYLDELRNGFAEKEFDVKALLTEIVVDSTVRRAERLQAEVASAGDSDNP